VSRRCPTCRTEYEGDVAFCGNDGDVNIEVTPEGEARDPHLGMKLGDYIVVAHVADGAMGAVYEARNAESRARVAIKVLHRDVAEDDIAVERFNREYETAGMFDHPHIVKVIDFGETADGSRFMTMEYLVGRELGDVLRRDGAMPPHRILRALAQVAQALDYAHSFGVIHRDLKPDNIFLCEGPSGDHVRLLDFGSVKLQVETGPKLTAFGTTLGSPYYMSPEQAKGLPDVDGRTDVFALGAILYEALSGKVAFEAPTVAEILAKIVRHNPPPLRSIKPDVPAAVVEVIDKAISKDKAKRYDTPVAMVDAAFAAYGIGGGSAAWAERPAAELEAALAGSARPPEPKLGIPSNAKTLIVQRPGEIATTPREPEPVVPREVMAQPVAPAGGSRVAMLAGLAVGAFVIAGGIAAAVFYLMG
jgi:serine/threonine protein kinase